MRGAPTFRADDSIVDAAAAHERIEQRDLWLQAEADDALQAFMLAQGEQRDLLDGARRWRHDFIIRQRFQCLGFWCSHRRYNK